ncbi:MAG: glucoamylase family protein [Saprospiraceae bacterium]|nr:glucoamylase family protein [Saprospiraceae bacterium]
MTRLIPLLLLFPVATALAQTRQAHAMTPYSTDELQRRTFHYFWDLADNHAQIPDRWPNLAFSSIAATGFGLSGYLVGVEHGWITRKEAADRVLKTLQTLLNLPQGDQLEGVAGYRGFFYHFLDHQHARRYRDVELSTIDTALLLAGILSCQSYFDRNDPTEADIRETADQIYRRVEWDWMLNANNRVSMGWKPEKGFLQAEWFGYTEAMILYVLALGSPTHPVPADAWNAYCQNYSWDTFMGQPHVNFGPLFGHQYSHVWIDFRGIQDDYMRRRGIDYFENSRRATLANHAYCVQNPGKHQDYSNKIWGLTACDGPADWLNKHDRQKHCGQSWEQFKGYNARGVATDYREDDGTIAPTAAGGSVPFAPEICLPALETMWNTYYDSLVGPYGFKDAFNPSFTACGQLPNGWFDEDYLGIDQGPILLMLENHRNGLIWEIMKKNPYIRNGLKKAGFSGGWLDAANAPAEISPASVFNPEVPVNPLFFFEKHTYRKNDTAALPYRLLRPADGRASNAIPGYVTGADGRLVKENHAGKKDKKLPLVVFLHGLGECGADNEAQLRNGVLAFVEPDAFRKNPCFLLAPQCPKGDRWSAVNPVNKTAPFGQATPSMQLLIELIERVLQENPAIDRNRIYLTGLSMGGFGTVDLLMRRPDLFAAAMPLCGGGDPAQATTIKNIPLWIFHGRRDDVTPPTRSRALVAALRAQNARVRYTEYETLGHAIWQETYYQPDVQEWLFAQKKGQ